MTFMENRSITISVEQKYFLFLHDNANKCIFIRLNKLKPHKNMRFKVMVNYLNMQKSWLITKH